jgi:hypothetical protein
MGLAKQLKALLLLSFALAAIRGDAPTLSSQQRASAPSAAEELERLLDADPATARDIFQRKIASSTDWKVSEAELEALGHRLIKQNKIDGAVTTFRINLDLFPGSWKAWDSLGEGLMYVNDEAASRAAYQKSLEVNPDNRNARKKLEFLTSFIYDIARETRDVAKYAPRASTGLKGPYLGQRLPGDVPALFAPGIVSTRGDGEYSCSFSPDGKEMVFSASVGRNRAAMFHSKLERDGWTFPATPPYSVGHSDYLPYIMPDGKKLLFGRIKKDENGATVSVGMYIVERQERQTFDRAESRLYPDAEGWMHVSATRDLTVYTTYLPNRKTARYRLRDGGYPEREIPSGGLHPGAHPAIAPDERYIVFDSERPGGLGEEDLYVCFRQHDGSWGEAVNLGETVNSPGSESIPHLSPDGKFLFYSARRDIYWVSTRLIDKLHPQSE